MPNFSSAVVVALVAAGLRCVVGALLPVTGGQCAGYLTNDEIAAWFAAARATFPDIVTEKITFGKTGEQRDLHAYCIGQCLYDVNLDSVVPAPSTLLTGMHHSREVTCTPA